MKNFKQVFAIFAAVLLSGFTAQATTTKTSDLNSTTSTRGYGNSFIFVEQGIEFSVFPDSQFDFYMQNYGPRVSVSVNTPLTSISFNSGYDYNAFVQYDEFGAMIQIEHVPIFYDFYGRVRQVGDVCINYNRFGYVTQVGGLFVYYNRFNRFTHCSGYINAFNPFYVFRPWHRFYRIPHFNHCVVFNRPYRQFYNPVRYRYTRPFVNNFRRTSAVASRRGNAVVRNRALATRGNDLPRNTVSSNTVRPRRNTTAAVSPRSSVQSTPRPRSSAQPRASAQAPKPRVQANTPKPRVSANAPKPRVSSSAPKPRVSTKPRSSKPRISSGTPQSKPMMKTKTSRSSQKARVSSSKRSMNSRSTRVASNSRRR